MASPVSMLPPPVNGTAMRSRRPLVLTRIGVRRLLVTGALTLGAIGCGADPADPGDTGDSGDSADADYNPDFMVGDWLADSLVMTSTANSEVVANLVELGAVFTLSVQPPGRYTAILQGFGQSSSESGRLTVEGEYVILTPMSPPGPQSEALWERMGESVILEGESEFDFNLDGTDETATLRQVLSPD